MVGRAGPKPHWASKDFSTLCHIQTAFQFYLIFLKAIFFYQAWITENILALNSMILMLPLLPSILSGVKELLEIKVCPCMSKNKMTSPHPLWDHQVRVCLVETPTMSLVKHILNQLLVQLPPTLCLRKWSHALNHAALNAYRFEYRTYLILCDKETQNCGSYSWAQCESIHLSWVWSHINSSMKGCSVEEFKEMQALAPVDTRLFGLLRVVLFARTAGCYWFLFTVPAVS